MGKYFVRFIANTSFSLSPRTTHVIGNGATTTFTLPSQQILAYERLLKIGDRYAFVDLGFDGHIVADSPPKAVEMMNHSINVILCVMCYCSLAPYQSPFVVFSYDAEDGIDRRETKFYSYNRDTGEMFKRIRPVEADIFREVWKQTDAHASDNLISTLDQMNRALRIKNIRGEFIYLWLGLEYLTQLLNDKFGFKREEKLPHCPECGQDISLCPHCDEPFKPKNIAPGTFDGVRRIAQEKMQLSARRFNKLHDIRSELVHKVGSFNVEHHSYVPILRELVIWCVAAVIELDDMYAKRIISQERLKTIDGPSVRLEYDGYLTGMGTIPDLHEVDAQPDVKYDTNTMQSTIAVEADGRLTMNNTPSYRFTAPNGVQLNISGVGLWDINNSGITSGVINNVETQSGRDRPASE